jgi:LPXTG-motif cell wall-anchored protein
MANKKINEGIQKIGEYEQKAHWIMIGGIALAVFGLGALVFGKKNSTP